MKLLFFFITYTLFDYIDSLYFDFRLIRIRIIAVYSRQYTADKIDGARTPIPPTTASSSYTHAKQPALRRIATGAAESRTLMLDCNVFVYWVGAAANSRNI